MSFDQDMCLKPAPWTAWRSYKSASGEAKSIIANEKSHKKIYLDDESSLIWASIEKGVSYKNLYDFATTLNVADQLDELLLDLFDQELIANKSILSDLKPEPVPEAQAFEDAENVLPEAEFQQWVMAQGFMFSTHWEMTYKCNESCVHCYNPGASHSPLEKPQRINNELSTEQAFKVMDKIAEGGNFYLTISGGEIMLRKDFYELVEYARKLGMAVNIYTNGLKLDQINMERLAKLWPSTVSISIYSDIPNVHDDITRVKGSYAKSVKALKELNAKGIRTSLKSIQMTHTLKGYKGIVSLSEDLGAIPETEIGLSPGVDGAIAPMLMSNENPAELIIAAMTPGFPIYVGDESNNFGESPKDPKSTVCSAGIAGLSFAADGNIYPCNSLPIKSGNLHADDPLEVWNAALSQRKKATSIQRQNVGPYKVDVQKVAELVEWQDVRLEDYDECGKHKRCSWCSRCPGMSLLETGRALAPSTTNCRIATAKMFAAILLKNGVSRDSVADKLGVSRQFGNQLPDERKSIAEPVRGSTSYIDPRSIKNSMKKDAKVDDKRGSYTTENGEVWLKSGSEWNIDSLKSFEVIRNNFDVLSDIIN